MPDSYDEEIVSLLSTCNVVLNRVLFENRIKYAPFSFEQESIDRQLLKCLGHLHKFLVRIDKVVDQVEDRENHLYNALTRLVMALNMINKQDKEKEYGIY